MLLYLSPLQNMYVVVFSKKKKSYKSSRRGSHIMIIIFIKHIKHIKTYTKNEKGDICRCNSEFNQMYILMQKPILRSMSCFFYFHFKPTYNLLSIMRKINLKMMSQLTLFILHIYVC